MAAVQHEAKGASSEARARARSRAAKAAAKTRARRREEAADEAWLAHVAAADVDVTSTQVSLATHHVMVANKSKDTKPELLVRSYLRSCGLTGYRLHWKAPAGRPDVCYPGRKLAIFVQGCFWHACPHCTPRRPTTRQEYWDAKFARNQARDHAQVQTLLEAGWTVVMVWECRLKDARRERTLREVAELVRAAGVAPLGPRVVEPGGTRPWRRV